MALALRQLNLIHKKKGAIEFFLSTLMVNFPTQMPDCNSHSPALLDLFISSDASVYSTMAFPTLGNSDHVVVLLSINFA